MAGNVFEWVEADPNKSDPFEAEPYIVCGSSFIILAMSSTRKETTVR